VNTVMKLWFNKVRGFLGLGRGGGGAVSFSGRTLLHGDSLLMQGCW
jgi:hypothetical protein